MDEGTQSSGPERGAEFFTGRLSGVHYLSGGKCKALWDRSKNSNSIITLNMRQTAVLSAAHR